jgi:hypothetical protein
MALHAGQSQNRELTMKYTLLVFLAALQMSTQCWAERMRSNSALTTGTDWRAPAALAHLAMPIPHLVPSHFYRQLTWSERNNIRKKRIVANGLAARV